MLSGAAWDLGGTPRFAFLPMAMTHGLTSAIMDARTPQIVDGVKAADSMANQTGGWALTWQGTGIKNSDFRNAQTIYSGIQEAVTSAGGKAALSVDGKYRRKPDVAIVVFGAFFLSDGENGNGG